MKLLIIADDKKVVFLATFHLVLDVVEQFRGTAVYQVWEHFSSTAVKINPLLQSQGRHLDLIQNVLWLKAGRPL